MNFLISLMLGCLIINGDTDNFVFTNEYTLILQPVYVFIILLPDRIIFPLTCNYFYGIF